MCWYTGEIAEAAIRLKEVLTQYKFDRTRRALFTENLKEYDKFCEMLRFITTLKCKAICRKKEDNETSCQIRDCCRNKNFYACDECELFESCKMLKSLEDLHGDSCIKNLQEIKQMGIDTWLEKSKRYWFGTKMDD